MDLKKSIFELIYNDVKLIDIEYTSSTSVGQIVNIISTKFKINDKLIKLFYDKKQLIPIDFISKILITQLSQIPNSKMKIIVVPQVNLQKILFKNSFSQIGNESNVFNVEVDIFSKFANAKNEIFNFFQNIFTEFNQKLNSANFLESPDTDFADDILKDEKLIHEIFEFKEEKIFYFLIKFQSIYFYSTLTNLKEEEVKKIILPNVGMFKLPNKNENFKIIIQTYNTIIKEIEVCNTMTVGELKDKVQEMFLVSKNYQDLTFLFFRLDDDNNTIAYYKMKKYSTVYLRGFYFPVIFCDYYTKQSANIHINIASQISEIIEIIINKFKLDCDSDCVQLICNGKNLDSEKYLIEYNIQKYQTLYFK